MRYLVSVCLVLLAAAVSACGSSVNLPPVEPSDVELYLPGTAPGEEYRVIARIDQRAPQETPDKDLIDRARAKAAELGADALIVSGIRGTTEGQVDLNLGRQVEKILEAVAVYFPARHPELEQ